MEQPDIDLDIDDVLFESLENDSKNTNYQKKPHRFRKPDNTLSRGDTIKNQFTKNGLKQNLTEVIKPRNYVKLWVNFLFLFTGLVNIFDVLSDVYMIGWIFLRIPTFKKWATGITILFCVSTLSININSWRHYKRLNYGTNKVFNHVSRGMHLFGFGIVANILCLVFPSIFRKRPVSKKSQNLMKSEEQLEEEKRVEERNSKLWNEDKVEQLKMFECAMDTTPQLITLICAAIIVGQLLDPKLPKQTSIMDIGDGSYDEMYGGCLSTGRVDTTTIEYEKVLRTNGKSEESCNVFHHQAQVATQFECYPEELIPEIRDVLTIINMVVECNTGLMPGFLGMVKSIFYHPCSLSPDADFCGNSTDLGKEYARKIQTGGIGESGRHLNVLHWGSYVVAMKIILAIISNSVTTMSFKFNQRIMVKLGKVEAKNLSGIVRRNTVKNDLDILERLDRKDTELSWKSPERDDGPVIFKNEESSAESDSYHAGFQSNSKSTEIYSDSQNSPKTSSEHQKFDNRESESFLPETQYPENKTSSFIPACFKTPVPERAEPGAKLPLVETKSIIPSFMECFPLIDKENARKFGVSTGIKLTFDENLIQIYRKNQFLLIKEVAGIVVLILTQLPFFLHRLSIVGLLVMLRVFHFETGHCPENNENFQYQTRNSTTNSPDFTVAPDKCEGNGQNWRAMYVIWFCIIRIYVMMFALLLQDHYTNGRVAKDPDSQTQDQHIQKNKRSKNKMWLEACAMLTVFNMTPSFSIGVLNYALGAVDFLVVYFAFLGVHKRIDGVYFGRWFWSEKGWYYLRIPYSLLAVSFMFYLIWSAIAMFWLKTDDPGARTGQLQYFDPQLTKTRGRKDEKNRNVEKGLNMTSFRKQDSINSLKPVCSLSRDDSEETEF